MKIALSATSPGLDGELSPHLGTSPFFVIVESASVEFESVENPRPGGTVGAEIASAHLLAGKGVTKILTGRLGSPSDEILSAEGIEAVTGVSGSIRELIHACMHHQL